MWKILLTVLVVVMDLLAAALILAAIALRTVAGPGTIAACVFLGLLLLNIAAVFLGARFRSKASGRDEVAGTFD